MDQMDVLSLLVPWGLFAAFIYGLGSFLVVLAKVLGRSRNKGGFRADSSAFDVDAGAAAILAEGLEAGSAGGDFGGDFGGFGGGGL